MKMRTFALSMLSLACTAGVFYNAYLQKKQFYPSIVYITKSNFSMAVLYLQAFLLVFLAAGLFRKIFFGQLRAAEMEHLIERSWYAVTETCLAFTVFRDDFSPHFVALFTLLLFTKSFHWLADDRIDYMERSPVISVLFHARAIGLMFVLSMVDIYFVDHAYNNTLIKGPSVQLVFGFEYAILMTMVVQVFVKYVLHTIDLHRNVPWENKAVYLLYLELLMGFSKVGLYLLFLVIMMKVHTFPLFVVRPMYLTVREFKKALNDVFMSRRAIHNMNTLYPTATEEELRQGDNVCIICREEMGGAGSGPSKKLPCNHIFHTTCLRSWFQRQQTCPTCRLDVFRTATNARNLRPQQQPPQQQQPQQPQQQQPQPPFPLQRGMEQFNQFFQNILAQQQQQPVHQAPPPPTSTTPQSPPLQTPPPLSFPPPPPLPHFSPPFFMPFGMPPPPPPPPLLMSFPYLPSMPPPMVLGDRLSSLSDEEVRLMEGEGRRAVEARIKCLTDIQTLLSAALTHMQHYLQAVNTTPPPPSFNPPSTTHPSHATAGGVSMGGTPPQEPPSQNGAANMAFASSFGPQTSDPLQGISNTFGNFQNEPSSSSSALSSSQPSSSSSSFSSSSSSPPMSSTSRLMDNFTSKDNSSVTLRKNTTTTTTLANNTTTATTTPTTTTTQTPDHNKLE